MAVGSEMAAVLIFLGLAAGAGSAGMLVRELAGGFAGGRSGSSGTGAVRLRRVSWDGLGASECGGLGKGKRQDAASTGWFHRVAWESGWTPMAAALSIGLVALVAGGLTLLVTDHLLAASASGLLGGGLVIAGLVVQRARRIARFQAQFPAALELIARSVRAGYTLDEAIVLAGREGPQPLAAEFTWCARQLALGLGMPAAVRSLAARVPLADARIFASLLGIHREVGGNIAEVLERLAEAIRQRLSYHRQLRAITSAGRMSAFLVAGLGPILFVYMLIFHPEYARAMLDSHMGQAFLAMAVVMEVIGMAWTARLLKPMY